MQADREALVVVLDRLVELPLPTIGGAQGSQDHGLKRAVLDLPGDLQAPRQQRGGLVVLAAVPKHVAEMVQHLALGPAIPRPLRRLDAEFEHLLPVSWPVSAEIEELPRRLGELPRQAVPVVLAGLPYRRDKVLPLGVKP